MIVELTDSDGATHGVYVDDNAEDPNADARTSLLKAWPDIQLPDKKAKGKS